MIKHHRFLWVHKNRTLRTSKVCWKPKSVGYLFRSRRKCELENWNRLTINEWTLCWRIAKGSLKRHFEHPKGKWWEAKTFGKIARGVRLPLLYCNGQSSDIMPENEKFGTWPALEANSLWGNGRGMCWWFHGALGKFCFWVSNSKRSHLHVILNLELMLKMQHFFERVFIELSLEIQG